MSWVNYALKRLVISVGLLLGSSILVFSIVRLIPGDPAMIVLGPTASNDAIQALRVRLGLTQPFWTQYFVWMSDLLTGKLGRSLMNDQTVLSLLVERYPRSLQLTIVSMLISILIAFPLGIVGAINRNSSVDYGALFFSQVGVSLPSFWLGILLILLFGKHLGMLPPSGYVAPTKSVGGFLSHVIMPATALGIINAAVITRFLRSEMIEEVSQDYVRTARAFGHPRKRIIRKYVLKNALVPTLTIIGLQFGYLIGGVVIIEQVFGYPGIGQLILDGLLRRDYPVVQAGLLILAATFIAVNLLVDLTYGYLDPKIKY